MSAPTKTSASSRTDRRVREDRRFVVGKGRFVADIALPGTARRAGHLPHPAARILRIDKPPRWRCPACITCSTAANLPRATSPLMAGLDTPNVPRRPLAVDVARYSGEWVAAVVADTRALAEDAAELVAGRLRAAAVRARRRGGLRARQPAGASRRTARTCCSTAPSSGARSRRISPRARTSCRSACKWGRSSTVPIETFGVLASWDPWREILDVWASIQMPKFPDQIALALKLPGTAVRVHHDVDVGGSYGVKRGIKHTVLVGYLARRLGFPVRLIEDRLENMRGGDAHGPERIFDVEIAFDDAGVIRSMKMRALDNVGAYAGRSPFQLGQADRRHRRPLPHQERAVPGDRGHHQQDHAGGGARLRPGADQLRDRARHRGGGGIAGSTGSRCAGATSSATRVSLSDPERHHLRQRRLSHRASTRCWRAPTTRALVAERDRLRGEGLLAGIGIAACLEPSGGNSRSSRCSTRRTRPPPTVKGAASPSISAAPITGHPYASRPGRATRRWSGTVVGEVLEIDPDLDPRGAAGLAESSLPSRARSAAAWRSCSAAPPSMPRRSSRRG